ncbi:MAG TPA: hypothetical protein PLY43_01410 [Ruminococcus sp.]|nr:hypothetical protein [Ruminococcus sp.]HOR21361.1 hypothetical protein [Ruminococcus sp.]
MEQRPAAMVFLMTMGITAVSFGTSCFLDWLFGESNAMMPVMIIFGLVLFFLPIFALVLESRMKEELSAKQFLLAYFGGYSVTAALGSAVICGGIIDLDKLFPHEFLGGIIMLVLLVILLGGLVWAAVFRITAAIVQHLQK